MPFPSLSSSTIRELFPDPAATAAVTDFGSLSPLFPEEEPAIARAVAKRALEFTAGRHCAREALRLLGHAPASLPRRPDRTPAWPAGVVGCIAHCHGYCGAVVASSEVFSGIGFDVEEQQRVHPKIWPKIATEEELGELHRLDPEAAARQAALLFSAKESFYKAQYPSTGVFLDFGDLRIHGRGPGHFDIRLTRPVPGLGEPGTLYSGQVRFATHHILTGVTLPPGTFCTDREPRRPGD